MDLQGEYGIKTSAKVGDTFFSLNYSQTESKPGPLANECRGLILGCDSLTEEQVNGKQPLTGLSILANVIPRFFNYGDSNAANINFDDTRTIWFDKLDGTNIILWFNPQINEWCVATRKVPNADRPIGGFENYTFRTLFEKALFDTLNANGRKYNTEKEAFDWYTSKLHTQTTYSFELTSPVNKVVVEYHDFRVHLLAFRDVLTGQEYWPWITGMKNQNLFGVPCCPFFTINNLKELSEFLDRQSPFQNEGVVVRDVHFNRVKVKNPAYVNIHRLKSGAINSPRNILELILNEKIDDVLPALDGYTREKSLKLQEKVRNFIKFYEDVYFEIWKEMTLPEQDVGARKEFALLVQKRNIMMAPMMERFSKKYQGHFRNWIASKKLEDGSYPETFLDTLLKELGKF